MINLLQGIFRLVLLWIHVELSTCMLFRSFWLLLILFSDNTCLTWIDIWIIINLNASLSILLSHLCILSGWFSLRLSLSPCVCLNTIILLKLISLFSPLRLTTSGSIYFIRFISVTFCILIDNLIFYFSLLFLFDSLLIYILIINLSLLTFSSLSLCDNVSIFILLSWCLL